MRRTAALLLAVVALVPGGARASSPFSLRGVIEGFYGPTYAHAERIDVIRFTGDRGMNVYVYAPKNDPWQRELWRQPYPPEEMARFAELASAHASVALAYSISPGESICYAAPSELDALVAKLEGFTAIGVDLFFLSFDDVAPALVCPLDVAAYPGGLGEAHADLVNRLLARMSEIDLVLVPTEYSGTDDTGYKRALREGMDARARVVWTGTQVVSETVSRTDAATYRDLVGHAVVLWDNYPVNDWTFPTGHPAVFMGPLRGRPADLGDAIDGLVANPMVYAALSKPALATVAGYAADPVAYQDDAVREAAWEQGVRDTGGEFGDALLAFARAARPQPSWGEPWVPVLKDDAPFYETLTDAFWAGWDDAFWPDAYGPLTAALGEAAQAYTALSSSPFFGVGGEGFLDRFDAGRDLLIASASTLWSTRPSLDLWTSEGPEIHGIALPSSPGLAAASAASMEGLEAAARALRFRVWGDLPERFAERTRGELASYFGAPGTGPPAVASVTVDGEAVPFDASGHFVAPVEPGTHEVVATDTWDRTTGVRVTAGA